MTDSDLVVRVLIRPPKLHPPLPPIVGELGFGGGLGSGSVWFTGSGESGRGGSGGSSANTALKKSMREIERYQISLCLCVCE